MANMMDKALQDLKPDATADERFVAFMRGMIDTACEESLKTNAMTQEEVDALRAEGEAHIEDYKREKGMK